MYSGECAAILVMTFATLCAFILSIFLVPLAQIVARRLNILDVPDGKIKKHAIPIPYLGGVAVYLGFLIPFLFIIPYNSAHVLFLLGSTLLLIVGLVDDILRNLETKPKIYGAISVAVLLVFVWWITIYICQPFHFLAYSYQHYGY